MRCAALNTGGESQTLDHIAPLSALMGMPLITTDEKNVQLIREFYPDVEARCMLDLEFRLGEIAEEFDALFECKFWAPHLKGLFKQLYGKEIRLVFCPHGQSDKGFRAPLLAPYGLQDVVLLYGDLMVEMLKELGIWEAVERHAFVGNYRLSYFLKHREFYRAKRVKFRRKNKTVIYAPTWRDADGASSFFRFGKKVVDELPDDWNLIIKPHPFLEQKDPAEFYAVTARVEEKENVVMIEDFPAVYPLLDQADIYLGDASSVGYDFLYFQRPLFFLPNGLGGRIQSCGKMIDPEKNIFLQMENGEDDEEVKRRLFAEAFRGGMDAKKEILAVLGEIGKVSLLEKF